MSKHTSFIIIVSVQFSKCFESSFKEESEHPCCCFWNKKAYTTKSNPSLLKELIKSLLQRSHAFKVLLLHSKKKKVEKQSYKEELGEDSKAAFPYFFAQAKAGLNSQASLILIPPRCGHRASSLWVVKKILVRLFWPKNPYHLWLAMLKLNIWYLISPLSHFRPLLLCLKVILFSER